MCSLAGRIAGSKSEMTECRSRCLPRRGGEDVWSSDDRCGGGRFWTKRSAGARVRSTYPRALPSRSYCCTGQAVFKADLHCRGTACGTELGLRKRRSKEQCVTRTCSSFSCAPALQQGSSNSIRVPNHNHTIRSLFDFFLPIPTHASKQMDQNAGRES